MRSQSTPCFAVAGFVAAAALALMRLPELIEYSCSENNRDVQHLVTTKPASGER